MTTIKSFTDLPQSKKLAEILPIESADMCYLSEESLFPKVNYNGMVFFNSEEEKPSTIIPCWSLAALLDILYQVKEIKHQRVTILVGRYAGQQWYVEFVKVQDEKSILLKQSKELVDACYEMILKLHELNLL